MSIAILGLLGDCHKIVTARAIMPYSTVEGVDCPLRPSFSEASMVTEQYNDFNHCEVNPRFQRNAEFSLGILMVLEGIMGSVIWRAQTFFYKTRWG